jgi:hypothetical protein
MCLYPRLIRNRKYVANNKNGGVIPPILDKRVLEVPVGCGKCMECRKQKSNQWRVRMLEDLRVNKNAKFITMTFSDESLQKIDNEIKGITGYDRDNEICRIAIRRFLERWRKKYKKSVRHWLVTELGQNYTERVHIHGLLWTDEKIDVIQERWGYGNVKLGDGKGTHYVNEQTVNYIVKYLSKQDPVHKEYTSKMFVSPGIGNNYLKRKDHKRNKYNGEKTIETYKTRKGTEYGLPIYYRNAIYNDDEKEKLWLMKLDKMERWVDGVRVDISESEEEYYKLLKEKRIKNKRLGYGDDAINWDLKKYENKRRNLKKLQRLKKLYG